VQRSKELERAQTNDSRDQNDRTGIQEDSASVVGNYNVVDKEYDEG